MYEAIALTFDTSFIINSSYSMQKTYKNIIFLWTKSNLIKVKQNSTLKQSIMILVM